MQQKGGSSGMKSVQARVQGGDVCNNQRSFFTLDCGASKDVRPPAIKGAAWRSRKEPLIL